LTFSDEKTSAPAGRVLWSVTKIAERDGVSKQAVSKNVRRLIDRGLFIERNARGEVGGVDVAEYYRLLGRAFDLAELESQSLDADNRRRRAMRNATREMARLIDRLPSHARQIAEAVAREGAAGAAVLLKALAFDLRKDVVETLQKIIAPAVDGVPRVK
jgi:hypothetical protein